MHEIETSINPADTDGEFDILAKLVTAAVDEPPAQAILTIYGDCHGEVIILRFLSLWVPRGHRRKGLASAIMHRTIEFAKYLADSKPFEIYLEAFPFEDDGEPAEIAIPALRTFYIRHGFLSVLTHPYAMRFTP